ncbi:hypothetical protein V6N12_041755 [Hibiscus sabdariffa]|uniref:SET domain-containing protein n=1 Tax=Hibiscus sabdariffa TaxID=183260 RepID=A0ABR2B3M3_9ROSI
MATIGYQKSIIWTGLKCWSEAARWRLGPFPSFEFLRRRRRRRRLESLTIDKALIKPHCSTVDDQSNTSRVTMARTEEAKLDLFLQWLQVNGAQFRGFKLMYCDSTKGFGIYSSNDSPKDGVLLVVPLDLAITPMRVLQDPLIGAECRAMFEEGEVDDRFLVILFLTVERLRKNSSWKPYLDMLPTTFGNPLWFTDDEVLELRGTTLYRATELRKKDLISVYEDKVKGLVKKLLVLDGDSESEVCFEDFLWANSIFWSRALNLPLPHSYVFPQIQEDTETPCPVENSSEVTISHSGEHIDEINGKRFEAHEIDSEVNGVTSTSKQEETVWVEGLLPGIDFCNHNLKAVATWEVDGTGSITEVPLSMYLISGSLLLPLCLHFVSLHCQLTKKFPSVMVTKAMRNFCTCMVFVVDNNPDDYLMIHYPGEAIQNISFSEFKGQLLVAQKAAMRWPSTEKICNFSWSGHRRTPSYLNKLVFPEDFMTALRTIAMQEDHVSKVSSMLEELVGPEGERQPSDTEIRTAVWEACGDSGALQLLVDLLQKKVSYYRIISHFEISMLPHHSCDYKKKKCRMTYSFALARMMDLEESSGTEDCDSELLENACIIGSPEQQTSKEANNLVQDKLMSRNRWCSIVYRRGQKELDSFCS